MVASSSFVVFGISGCVWVVLLPQRIQRLLQDGQKTERLVLVFIYRTLMRGFYRQIKEDLYFYQQFCSIKPRVQSGSEIYW